MARLAPAAVALAVLLAALVAVISLVPRTEQEQEQPARSERLGPVPREMQGQWQRGALKLTVRPRDHRITFADGRTAAGSASGARGRLQLSSRSGTRCASRGPGSYAYALRGDRLVLRVLTDRCRARADALQGTWRVSSAASPATTNG